jgi:exodeoxyribonuclease V alpha subunit
MNDTAYESFVPLARLALGDGYDGTCHQRWVRPLAQLLEAASRGVGYLPLSVCPLDREPPAEFFSVADGRVMLPRNAGYWREARERIETLHSRAAELLPDEAIARALDSILPPLRQCSPNGTVIFDNDGQRLAVAALVDATIGVLTGGPGTGKTTSAAALLAIRKRLMPELSPEQVLLCAPTGKAACRLGESMKAAAARLHITPDERNFLCGLVPQTLHRALQWGPKPPEKGGPFARGLARPLTQELVLVDEASMVDLYLMTHLLRALSPRSSLLLLGDSDQLESVDTGGILAELVLRGAGSRPLPAQMQHWTARLGTDAQRILDQTSPSDGRNSPLPGLVVRLHHSYRAKQSPWILELAGIAKPGARSTVEDFVACCHRHEPNLRLHQYHRELRSICRDFWLQAQAASRSWTWEQLPGDAELGATLRQFQLLCCDNAQVARANRLGVSDLWGDVPQPDNLALPHGCPVLVTQNRMPLGVFNGDVGIALGPAPGQAAQVVAFPGLESPIAIAQLPAHQPAFALTIHKSQGSEWARVAIDLPSESELLDRNLLYTAISRSSGTLDIYADSERALTAILGEP